MKKKGRIGYIISSPLKGVVFRYGGLSVYVKNNICVQNHIHAKTFLEPRSGYVCKKVNK
jgi:hypothetical protein